MGLFALLSIGTFSLPQTEFAADRLGIPVSLLLTSTAYSLTVSEQIPKVGYLTVLEAYVLLSALFIGLICLGVILLNCKGPDTPSMCRPCPVRLEPASPMPSLMASLPRVCALADPEHHFLPPFLPSPLPPFLPSVLPSNVR